MRARSLGDEPVMAHACGARLVGADSRLRSSGGRSASGRGAVRENTVLPNFMSLLLKLPQTFRNSTIPKIGRLEVRSNLDLGKSRQNLGGRFPYPDLPQYLRSPPISPDLPRPPPISGSTSNARPTRSGSSYGPIRPCRPLRHACRPGQTAERHELHSNGPSAAAAAEDRTNQTRSARMTAARLPSSLHTPNCQTAPAHA